MPRPVVWSTLFAIAAVVALSTVAKAPLPSTLETGNVLGLHDAHWEDADGNEHTVLKGGDVIVYMQEGVNQHPDLENCIDPDHHEHRWHWLLHDKVPNHPFKSPERGHGTAVAGVLCGDGTLSEEHGQGEPIVGVAPEVRLFSFQGSCFTFGGSPCAPWLAEHDVRVYSNSVGVNPEREAEDRGADPDADILFVQAVGNYGGNGSEAETFSWIDQERTLGVANGFADGTDVSDTSSRGDKSDPSTWPHITAPGCSYTVAFHPYPAAFNAAILNNVADVARFGYPDSCASVDVATAVTNAALGYSIQSGTSIATPYVSGVAALMFQVNPDLSALDAKYLLTRTAEPFLPVDGDETPSQEEFYEEHGYKAGYGFVNATAAVAASNYLALNPDASLEEAMECSTTHTSGVGTLEINPWDGCSS